MSGTPWRRGVILALAMLVLGAAGTTAGVAKEKAWVVKDLPRLDGWIGTFANHVSDSKYIAGGWVDGDGGVHGGWWYQGKAHDVASEIGMPEGFGDAYSVVYDLNDNGLLGGGAWTAEAQIAVLWDTKEGTATNLHPGGEVLASEVNGVSESGVAVGYIIVPTDSRPYYGYRPYVWRKGGQEQFELALGDYAEGFCYGVNARGDVAGFVFTRGETSYRAALWTDDDTLVDIGEEIEEADPDVYWSRAFDVGDSGTVVGDALTVTGSGEYLHFAWTWTEKDGVTILPQGETLDAIAWETNTRYVVGGVGPSGDDEYAAVWVDGELEILPHSLDLYSMEASGVTNNGFVVGYGFTEDDASRGFPQGWTAELE